MWEIQHSEKLSAVLPKTEIEQICNWKRGVKIACKKNNYCKELFNTHSGKMDIMISSPVCKKFKLESFRRFEENPNNA